MNIIRALKWRIMFATFIDFSIVLCISSNCISCASQRKLNNGITWSDESTLKLSSKQQITTKIHMHHSLQRNVCDNRTESIQPAIDQGSVGRLVGHNLEFHIPKSISTLLHWLWKAIKGVRKHKMENDVHRFCTAAHKKRHWFQDNSTDRNRRVIAICSLNSRLLTETTNNAMCSTHARSHVHAHSNPLIDHMCITNWCSVRLSFRCGKKSEKPWQSPKLDGDFMFWSRKKSLTHRTQARQGDSWRTKFIPI